MRYDLSLFLSLNEEYRSKPLVPKPPRYDPASLSGRARKRARNIDRKVPVSGKRVLEIGCGRGEVCLLLAEEYGCDAVGVDVSTYPEWEVSAGSLSLIQADLSQPDAPDIGSFDLIYSNAVWEHLRHPFAMLRKAYDLLRPGGQFLLSANLYRGPKASHRYREVFFPWPHLLFSDDVFYDFYEHLGRNPTDATWVNRGSIRPDYAKTHQPKTAAWVNQLSIGDYYRYFDIVGLEMEAATFSVTPIDEDFLARFSDKLDRFPRYDLQRDFIHVKLSKPA